MLRRTRLHAVHAEAGATFTAFAGYDMPVHYGSIKEEHLAVRGDVGLFDVSHMSNLFLSGPRAAAAVSRVCPFDAAALEVGKGKYSVVLRDDGTVLDDVFTFRLDDARYMMVPNAGMDELVQRHIQMHTPEAHVEDQTPDWAILALQGPRAKAVLAAATPDRPPRFHRITEMQLDGVACLVSGTGYTGEKGVELFVPATDAVHVWRHIMAAAPEPPRPVGLGARDTLRLEKGYCLAGHEFAGGRTPLEAGLGWLVDWEASSIGMDALQAQRETDHERLWGLTLERGIPRQGHNVQRDDEPIGVVTSGTMSPSLGHGIGLAYLQDASEGDEVQVDIRGRSAEARVASPPFL